MQELATLDAEIAAAEEQRLDERFVADDLEADDTPASGSHNSSADSDGFDVIHRQAERRALTSAPEDPGLSMFLLPPEPQDALATPFEAVHHRTITLAVADEVHRHEAEGGLAGAFARVRSWWSNMRDYLAGWREEMLSRADTLLNRWEREEMEHEARGRSTDPDRDYDREPDR